MEEKGEITAKKVPHTFPRCGTAGYFLFEKYPESSLSPDKNHPVDKNVRIESLGKPQILPVTEFVFTKII